MAPAISGWERKKPAMLTLFWFLLLTLKQSHIPLPWFHFLTILVSHRTGGRSIRLITQHSNTLSH